MLSGTTTSGALSTPSNGWEYDECMQDGRPEPASLKLPSAAREVVKDSELGPNIDEHTVVLRRPGGFSQSMFHVHVFW